jgi:hypothetical protein
MKEHLTVAELLAALKHCVNWPKNGFSCAGCPNAVPGTEDKDGFCQCRFDTYDETIRILESLVTNN